MTVSTTRNRYAILCNGNTYLPMAVTWTAIGARARSTQLASCASRLDRKTAKDHIAIL